MQNDLRFPIDNTTPTLVVNYIELIIKSAKLNFKNNYSSEIECFLGNTFLIVARTVTIYAVCTFFGPLGAIYNGGKALTEYLKGRKESGEKHFRAALNDFACGYPPTVAIAFYCFCSTPFYLYTSAAICAVPALRNRYTRIEMISPFIPKEQLEGFYPHAIDSLLG